MIKVLPKMPPNVALVDAESTLPRFRRERLAWGSFALGGSCVPSVHIVCLVSVGSMTVPQHLLDLTVFASNKRAR